MQDHCITKGWKLDDGSYDYRLATSQGDMTRVESFLGTLAQKPMATPQHDMEEQCRMLTRLNDVQGWFNWPYKLIKEKFVVKLMGFVKKRAANTHRR